MKKSPDRGSVAHLLFILTITIKGFDGAVESLAGLVIAITGPQRIYRWAIRVTAPELYCGTHVQAVHVIRHGAQKLATTPIIYAVSYLLAHGIVKFGVAVGLLKNAGQWIFAVACAVLAGFIIYMSFKLSAIWSNWLLAVVTFDAFTLAMVINEWRSLRNV